jgi:hypothetical protein
MRAKSICVLVASAAILLMTLGAAPAASARAIARDHTDAFVNIVHGLPGEDLGVEPSAPVDVLLDGETCVLRGLTFGTVAGPVVLEPGSHTVRITHADPDDPCADGAEVLIDEDFAFETGDDLSLVAHLDGSGAVAATMFVDDFSRVDPSGARLTVHHTAALAPVDISVRRQAPDSPGLVFLGATNGARQAAETRWGAWGLIVGPPSTDDVLWGPVPLMLNPFTANLVYVVGSESGGTLTLIHHRVYLRFKARKPWPSEQRPATRLPDIRIRPN